MSYMYDNTNYSIPCISLNSLTYHHVTCSIKCCTLHGYFMPPMLHISCRHVSAKQVLPCYSACFSTPTNVCCHMNVIFHIFHMSCHVCYFTCGLHTSFVLYSVPLGYNNSSTTTSTTTSTTNKHGCMVPFGPTHHPPLYYISSSVFALFPFSILIHWISVCVCSCALLLLYLSSPDFPISPLSPSWLMNGSTGQCVWFDHLCWQCSLRWRGASSPPLCVVGLMEPATVSIATVTPVTSSPMHWPRVTTWAFLPSPFPFLSRLVCACVSCWP